MCHTHLHSQSWKQEFKWKWISITENITQTGHLRNSKNKSGVSLKTFHHSGKIHTTKVLINTINTILGMLEGREQEYYGIFELKCVIYIALTMN